MVSNNQLKVFCQAIACCTLLSACFTAEAFLSQEILVSGKEVELPILRLVKNRLRSKDSKDIGMFFGHSLLNLCPSFCLCIQSEVHEDSDHFITS